MTSTTKRYKKIRKRLHLRIKIALWLIRRGHGNKELLERYTHKQLDSLHMSIQREFKELLDD